MNIYMEWVSQIILLLHKHPTPPPPPIQKKNVLRVRPTKIFRFGRFFFLIFPKSCNISHFLTKIYNFS